MDCGALKLRNTKISCGENIVGQKGKWTLICLKSVEVSSEVPQENFENNLR